MSDLNRISNSELQRVASIWARGFHAIYHKEIAYWFGTHRWINQLMIWMSLAVIPPLTITPDGTRDRGVAILALFLWSGSNMMSIGTILLAQSTIIEEKLTQTLLWIFSKPLSPAGFILGKFAAYAVLIGAIVLGAPSIVAYIGSMMIGLPAKISVFNYLAAIWMLYLLLLFNLAIAILLRVLFNRTGAVTALSLLIFFSGSSLQSYPLFKPIEPYTVWALQHNSYQTMTGNFHPTTWFAMISAVGSIVFLLVAATWWIDRSEF
jgi:ABC-2 type transport system permease protein